LAWIVAKNNQQRWARQGEEISHWTISKITEDKVTVTSGQRSADLIVKRPPEKSLLLKDTAESKTGIKVISTVSSVSEDIVPVSVPGSGNQASAAAVGGNVKTPVPVQVDPNQSNDLMQTLLSAIQGGGDSSKEGGTDPGLEAGLMDILRESMKNMNAQPAVAGGKIESKPKDVSGAGEVGIDRLDAAESKKINDIGKELKKDAASLDPRRRALRSNYNSRRERLSRDAIERERRKAQERKEP
jgi:hypothetical protein